MIPAVVYGRSVTPQPITVAANDFQRLHRVAGESTLIDLDVRGSAPLKALIQDVARNPMTGTVTHVDFRAVSMAEKITTRIPLRFVGVAPATATGTCVLVKHLDHLEVEALPDALVHEIVIDLASLVAMDSTIHVRDIVMPPGITVRTRLDDVVAAITELVVEEEVPVAAAATTAAEPEVVGKKGKDEAAAAAAPAEEGKGKKEKREKK
jgi:large subunit ribosomal protein L25